MKKSKRIVSLLMALAFAFSLMASTALAAVREGDVQPCYRVCPMCLEGALREVVVARIKERTRMIGTLDCGCVKYEVTYRIIKQVQCERCPFREPSTDEYITYTEYDNSNCKGHS